jgi:hypothetical protein
MLNVFRIEKEQGDIIIVPELQQLAKSFHSELTVAEFERPNMVMVLEWAALASVAIFLTKPFFEEMMKELGKETGKSIVSAIKKQFFEAKEKGSRLYGKVELDQLLAARRRSELEYDELRRAIGRQHAPIEIAVDFHLHENQEKAFRFVFLPSLDERQIELALERLPTEWEEIIQKRIADSASSFKVAGMPSEPIDRHIVYLPSENMWVGTRDMIKYAREGNKL